MKELTVSFLILHTSMTLFTGVFLWVFINLILPDMIIKGFITIPLFFFITGFIYIYCIKKNSNENSTYLVNLYLMMKIIKMFISSVIIFIYWVLHSQGLRKFIVVFLIFYLISMIWETHIYLRMEKYIKYKQKI